MLSNTNSNSARPGPAFRQAHKGNLTLGQTRKAFAALPLIRIEPYDKERFFQFWADHIRISPHHVADHYLAELEGLQTNMVLDYDQNSSTLEIEVVARALGQGLSALDPHIKETRSFNLQDGVINAGFIHNAMGQNAPATALFRRSLELGFMLGCADIRIEATRKGNYVWANVFDVDHVCPDFIDNMQARLDRLGKALPEDLKAHISGLIQNGNIAAIAALTQKTPATLDNMAYMDLYAETMYKENPPPITLGKYLLIDDKTKCWFGSADLDNPTHCARLEKRLGPWTDPILRTRAINGLKETPTATPLAGIA